MNKPSSESDPGLEAAILDLVLRSDYQPVKARRIAQALGMRRTQALEVKRAIKRLVREGKLVFGDKRLVQTAGSAAAPHRESRQDQRVIGVFRRTASGVGFVRPRLAGPADAPPADIYIAPADTHDASTGDTVAVQLLRRGDRRQLGPQGAVVEIVQRDTHQFVGTYFESGGAGYVQVDGTLFAQPIYVGDPGAKGARPDDKVVLEMVRFPSHVRDGEGVLTEVLGPRGKPGVDTLSILREYDLPEGFPEDALDEARRLAEAFQETAPPERLDFSQETVLTIDPADARDFDDAISLVEQDNGHWLLGVHIADVAHLVQPHTALDREARQRATSVYLPDRVVPMLPEILSNSLASLQAGKLRYTKTALLEFTPDGLRASTQLHNSVICSSKRLNYEQVDEFLASPESWRKRLGVKVHDLLLRMHRLAMILRQRRFRRGALELALREVRVDLDRQGRVAGAHVVENTESHQIIEEFMLAANEAVAERIHQAGWPFLRRIHKPPSERKLRALREFVAELGLSVDSLESRFAMQRLLADVRGKPEQHAVNYALLRSMQRAVYGPAEEGHYALASECYCHFTSPIRRYPDITVHRLVDALLKSEKPRLALDELVVLGEHCSDQEQKAESAERDLTRLKLLGYLSTRRGEELDAIITGVESYGLFAQGIDLPAEGLIPIAALSDDYYRYDRAAHTLSGYRRGNCFRLGDTVRVAVARVDLERRELDFALVAHHGRKTPAGRQSPARRSRKGKAAPRPERPTPRGAKRGKRTKKPPRTPRSR